MYAIHSTIVPMLIPVNLQHYFMRTSKHRDIEIIETQGGKGMHLLTPHIMSLYRLCPQLALRKSSRSPVNSKKSRAVLRSVPHCCGA